MAISLSINGVTYQYPEQGDSDWGPDASAWAQAVTNSLLQTTGGLFNLSGELSFGSNAGIRTLYLRSQSINPATNGLIRLANTDTIEWRNADNNGNLPLGVTTGNKLTYNGVELVDISSSQILTNKTLATISLENPTITFPAHPSTLIYSTAGTGTVGGFVPLDANTIMTVNGSHIPTMVNYLTISQGGTNNPILFVGPGSIPYGDGAKLLGTPIPSGTSNQVLQTTGSTPGWKHYLDVNVYKSATAPSTPVQGDVWYDTTYNTLRAYSGSTWESTGSVNNITDLSDVTIGSPVAGQILKFNGTVWINDVDLSGGSPSWGSITGTLSNQSDLQSALDLKSPSTHNHSGTYEPANANIQTHIASTSNPHQVTKTQIGLSNVDNTSDMNKPVSTAQQSALNGKSDISHTHTIDNLSDVTIISPANNEVLSYNSAGGYWRNVAAGGTTWGGITGTLSNQSDLTSALNAKQPLDADLTAIAALGPTAGFLKKNGIDSWNIDTNSYALASHNHSGVYEPANINIQEHIANSSNPHGVTKSQVGLGNVENLKVNLTATTAPTAGNDTTQGYSIGSRWFDTISQIEYTCLNATTAAAVWRATTSGGETNRLTGVNTQTGNYTLALTDENKMVRMNVSTSNYLTVPPNSSVPFEIGTIVHICQYGTGQTAITAGSGVTLRTPTTLNTNSQYAIVSIAKVDTNEWLVSGYLETL